MVFWSSFAKKVKQAVSQVAFDLLKNRVQSVEQINQNQDTKINNNANNITQLQSTTTQHTQSINTNTANINTLDNKVDSVISGLQNGNIVNYTGPYNNSKNYNLAEAITYQDKWYVSNIDNNMGHTPSGSSDQYWELLSEPTINLSPYLTKSEASNTYATISTTNSLNTRLSSAEQSINNKADRSYVDNLITYSSPYKLYDRMIWLHTRSENSRNWKWVGRLDNNIVPQNLINIEFELRGYDFGQTGQYYELIKYGWYKTPFYVIVWLESPESSRDDYNAITQNTYIRFVSKR